MCVVRTKFPEYRVVTPFWMPHAVAATKIQCGLCGKYAAHMEAQKRKTETTRKAWPYARPMANDSLMMKMPENTPPMKNDSLRGKHLAYQAGYRNSLLRLMDFDVPQPDAS